MRIRFNIIYKVYKEQTLLQDDAGQSRPVRESGCGDT